MLDSYQAPALVLTALLLPAFGYIYLRFRDTRTLLWFLGFLFAIAHAAVPTLVLDLSERSHPWLAAGQTSILISSALFLASLSPLRFRVGRLNVFTSFRSPFPWWLFHSVSPGFSRRCAHGSRCFLIFPALGSGSRCRLPFLGRGQREHACLAGGSLCIVVGGAGIWTCFATGGRWPLTLVECANHFMTALLLIFVFRRFSPGVVLSVLGFSAWSLTPLKFFHAIAFQSRDSHEPGPRASSMAKVVAAMGMILLALEDELAINKAAQGRERRARRELEAYASLILSRGASWRTLTAREARSARPWWRTAGLRRRRCC
jgi:hypothetical protein